MGDEKENKKFRLVHETADKVKKELEPWIELKIELAVNKLPKVTWKDFINSMPGKIKWTLVVLSLLLFYLIGRTGCKISVLYDAITEPESTIKQLENKTSQSPTDSTVSYNLAIPPQENTGHGQ